jgi:cellulose biosynthesis protein BcsQ
VLRNSIAVMNAKGRAGKSTLVLALAETLSAKFGKNVLVIDTDAQASVSMMLMSPGTMKELGSATDDEFEEKLRANRNNRCFAQAVPRTTALQHASHFAQVERRYEGKYPGESGQALQRVCSELLDRVLAANGSKPTANERTR